jgi:hypothetical protein
MNFWIIQSLAFHDYYNSYNRIFFVNLIFVTNLKLMITKCNNFIITYSEFQKLVFEL